MALFNCHLRECSSVLSDYIPGHHICISTILIQSITISHLECNTGPNGPLSCNCPHKIHTHTHTQILTLYPAQNFNVFLLYLDKLRFLNMVFKTHQCLVPADLSSFISPLLPEILTSFYSSMLHPASYHETSTPLHILFPVSGMFSLPLSTLATLPLCL